VEAVSTRASDPIPKSSVKDRWLGSGQGMWTVTECSVPVAPKGKLNVDVFLFSALSDGGDGHAVNAKGELESLNWSSDIASGGNVSTPIGQWLSQTLTRKEMRV
jgi:hypothetical protein